jgi:murein DD-endopeptidase MepM/ murein hydrolase activator NlpD
MSRRVLVSAAAGGLLLLLVIVLFFASSPTILQLEPKAVSVVGAETPLALKASNPHGVRQARAFLEQNGKRTLAWESPAQSATRLFFSGKNAPDSRFQFTVGKKQVPALEHGKARLIVETTANDFRAKNDQLAFDVTVNTDPPRVFADGFQHYINQGGAELVTFRAGGYWTEAGVRVGKYTFRSFPMPGAKPAPDGTAELFSLFAFPWDVPADTAPEVYARNPAGAEAAVRFWFRTFPKEFRRRQLDITDAFMDKVASELDRGDTAPLLDRFLKINGEMRRTNNATLAGLRKETAEGFTWSTPFVQLANSKVESVFADERTYMYQGKAVDKQVHLGFDLSVNAASPVTASNDGKVVWAAPLGIYGNCVVIDHGYALQSIYGHLSQLAVKPGETVKKGQEVGRSGATGLAGGDHLHYSMQIDGVQVNPVEWWDGHWIHDRIWSKIPPPQTH